MRLTSTLPGVGDGTQPEEDAPERVIWNKTEDQEGEENAALSHRLNKCRFGSALTQPDQLARAAQRMAAAASRPATIIVFGSYARGDATEGSDLDLVVVEPTVPSKSGG